MCPSSLPLSCRCPKAAGGGVHIPAWRSMAQGQLTSTFTALSKSCRGGLGAYSHVAQGASLLCACTCCPVDKQDAHACAQWALPMPFHMPIDTFAQTGVQPLASISAHPPMRKQAHARALRRTARPSTHMRRNMHSLLESARVQHCQPAPAQAHRRAHACPHPHSCTFQEGGQPELGPTHRFTYWRPAAQQQEEAQSLHRRRLGC